MVLLLTHSLTYLLTGLDASSGPEKCTILLSKLRVTKDRTRMSSLQSYPNFLKTMDLARFFVACAAQTALVRMLFPGREHFPSVWLNIVECVEMGVAFELGAGYSLI